MLSRVTDSTNFTATIIRNNAFREGVKQARTDTATGFLYEANAFANAVKYLENDGTEDVYEIVKDDYRKDNYSLTKNGDVVLNRDYPTVGQSAKHLFMDYVASEGNNGIAKPFTPGIDTRVRLGDINNNLEKIKEAITKTQEDIENIRSVHTTVSAAEEVNKKLDTIA